MKQLSISSNIKSSFSSYIGTPKSKRHISNTLIRNLSKALDQVLKMNDDTTVGNVTKIKLDDEIEKQAQELVRTLKKAKSLANALRWKVMTITEGEYLPNDFFVLRQNLNTCIYPCMYRIRKNHIPALMRLNEHNKL